VSRNLCKTSCDQCGGIEITVDEDPRPLRKSEAVRYFDEIIRFFPQTRFSAAHCSWCYAKYLSWHDGGGDEITDLSYRSTFNDEPGQDDLPDKSGVVTSVLVVKGELHDRVKIWNRGGLAGELCVVAGDGARIADRLGHRPEEER